MKLKDKKGSISIFVLVMLLFMSAFLIISFASNVNKSKAVKEQFNIISGIYSYGGGDKAAYDKAYTELRNKNRQTLQYDSEALNLTSVSKVELEKTFREEISNYRIYGNSIQDGTPSPDNPVEVQSVGDKVNLFDYSTLLNSNYIEIINEQTDEFKFINTTNIPSTYIDAKENTIYTISYEVNIVEEQSIQVTVYYTDGSYNSITTSDKKVGEYVKKVGTTAANKTIEYIKFGGSGGIKVGTAFKKIQIEEGDTATEYVPYGKYKIPVKVSQKNLFNYEHMSEETTESGVTLSRDRDVFKLNGECTEKHAIKSNEFNLGEGTYTITIRKIKGSFNNSLKVYLYQHGGALIKATVMGEDYVTATVTISDELSKDNQYISIYMSAGDSFDNCEFTIQIEEGTNSTEYQLYNASQTFNIYLDEPLRKLDNYIDYIDFKNNELVRKVKKISMNGSENWINSDNGLTNTYRSAMPLTDVPTGEALIPIMSNKFIGILSGTSSKDEENIQISSNRVFVRILRNRFEELGLEESASGFKEWVQSNNFDIYYPIDSDDNKETIELPTIYAYEDYTKIEVLTEIAPSKIEVEYQGYTLE